MLEPVIRRVISVSEMQPEVKRETGVAGVTVVAVGRVVGGPVGAEVETIVRMGTRVPVPLVVGVVPAGIRVVGIVPGVHCRVGSADSETDPAGSEADGNREAAPRILSGCSVRSPADRESDQQSRSHQFRHDVLLARSCYPHLHRACHPTFTAESPYFLRANVHPRRCSPSRSVLTRGRTRAGNVTEWVGAGGA